MAAAQRAEEEARQREKEAAKMQGEVEEAYEMLGSLDNALKAFTGRFGLEEVLYTVYIHHSSKTTGSFSVCYWPSCIMCVLMSMPIAKLLCTTYIALSN